MDWKYCKDDREKYQLYLASREWAVKRDAVASRSGGVCERCRCNPAAQVHHLTYIRKYAEELSDLVHLCKPCHEFIHAKRERDPALDAPAMLGSRVIEHVYLAGKITGTNWRDSFFDSEGRWSRENHGLLSELRYGRGELVWSDYDIRAAWGVVPDCVEIPGGKRLSYSGPWWADLQCGGGHSTARDAGGRHLFATRSTHDELFTDVGSLFRQINWSLRLPHTLVFAWLTSRECLGTLIELGIASASGACIALAMPQKIFWDRELWMAQQCAEFLLVEDDPLTAWKSLWTGKSVRSPEAELNEPL